jgi:hypothetical protein
MKKIRREDFQQLLQPYKSFVMVLARRYRKNHAKPFGPDLKVKQMLDSLRIVEKVQQITS